MVVLAEADEETVGEAMTLAWRNTTTVTPRAAKKRARTASQPARRR